MWVRACVRGVRAWRTCVAYVRGVRAWRTCVAYVRGVRAWRTCVAYVRGVRACRSIRACVHVRSFVRSCVRAGPDVKLYWNKPHAQCSHLVTYSSSLVAAVCIDMEVAWRPRGGGLRNQNTPM